MSDFCRKQKSQTTSKQRIYSGSVGHYLIFCVLISIYDVYVLSSFQALNIPTKVRKYREWKFLIDNGKTSDKNCVNLYHFKMSQQVTEFSFITSAIYNSTQYQTCNGQSILWLNTEYSVNSLYLLPLQGCTPQVKTSFQKSATSCF